MKLTYHEGRNFGDMLNPIILKKLKPDFFDDNSSELFLGIGSILGLKRPETNTQRVVVFSSGIGGNDPDTYGSKPTEEDLKKYDFTCVRGPLTAKFFGLDKEKAVCDGAILLPLVWPIQKDIKKKYTCSYIPHLGSLKYCSKWSELLEEIGIHLIDPRNEPEQVVLEIQQSELLLAEAMHGAIIADAYRVPWLALKTNPTINEFKWKDYTSSLDLNYNPTRLNTLFDRSFALGIIGGKLSNRKMNNKLIANALCTLFMMKQNLVEIPKVKKVFRRLKLEQGVLSSNELLGQKQQELMQILNQIQ